MMITDKSSYDIQKNVPTAIYGIYARYGAVSISYVRVEAELTCNEKF